MDNEGFFGKRGLTVKVFNNNVNGAITQLKRKINTEGLTKELRKRKHFEPNTAKRRRALAEAQSRWRKKQDLINEIQRPKRKVIKKPANRPVKFDNV
jgi:ribosomal protein S21